MTRTLARLSVFLLPVLFAIGCSGPAQVTGSVSYNGKTVKSGTVIFRAPDGTVYPGNIVEGRYAVEGLPSGPVTVAVTSPDPAAPVADPSGRTPPAPASKTPAKKTEGWFPVPPKFANPDSSGQATTLKPGANTYPIDLKD